ncbi:NAD-dependent epimerase/dehydratase family protein [Paenibacillus sp. MMS20-IR301]|uniref:NAD-dependent epimerase/dehydratase family protein n=1 Tax=Paenibacillus sp. MMS20-IR301 TaxID=2895946 RepID=UPI0028E1965D|nr:NAD-dependent epimerase/dehydratase family protein [Paenibacillus sp. MMS20-IR301]WNS46271.1 NAD-dependent epimerase/dehydratase family protein [Paenibacillus sp. MMS20-IR301]
MRKILVLGGTRFFGKRLVEKLLQDGDSAVTILTRGLTGDDFGGRVTRLAADRTDAEGLARAAGDTDWDVIYDNICFSPDEAAAAVRIFSGKVKRYILTSSLSVYNPQPDILTEADFDPLQIPLQTGGKEKFSYQEGKQLAEAVMLGVADFPVAAVRFPIVLGVDDYTRRLHFHIEHVRAGQPIGIPNPRAEISFIRSDEAADFLYWLGSSELSGPVNACSDGTLSIGGVITAIEEITGIPAVIRHETAAADQSPFGIGESWFMDTAKARSTGFSFLSLSEWFPELVSSINSSLGKHE